MKVESLKKKNKTKNLSNTYEVNVPLYVEEMEMELIPMTRVFKIFYK